MLTFPRSAALRFRQILKRSVTADLARGPAPRYSTQVGVDLHCLM